MSRREDNLNQDLLLGGMLSREIPTGLEKRAKNCITPKEISEFVSGKMGKEARASCINHILGCKSCYESLVIFAKIMDEKKSHLASRPLALAASILVAVVALYLFIFIFPQKDKVGDPLMLSNYLIDKSFQNFLVQTNQTVIKDRGKIQTLQRIIGNFKKSISNRDIRELHIKWPVRTTKDILWKPERVNVKIQGHIMIIEILNY